MVKVGIIGLGHMGQAMVQGFYQAQVTNQVIGYDYDSEKSQKIAQAWKIQTTNDYQKLIEKVELLIVAVRPNQIDAVVKQLNQFDLKDKILISIISGLKISEIQKKFSKNVLVVRALPNLNAGQGMSATGIQFDQVINSAQKKLVFECLNQFGSTYEITEEQFSAFTVVGGCTPAYFFKMVDAIYQSGMKNGLKDELALEVAIQSGIGSLTTLKHSELKPQVLVDAVCVPNGITIEGINYLEEKKFQEIIDEAIKKSIKKDLQPH